MIFLTVGTQFPFDRLVRAVDQAIASGGVDEEVFAQIADSAYRPCNFEAVSYLEKDAFDKRMCEASCVISHAGMGAITTALDNRKPLLVMPRLKRYCEVVNDHQVAIARQFERLGHLLVAYREDDVSEKIKALRYFVPAERDKCAAAVVQRISDFIEQVRKGR
jgi:UDP-N-acetylglucosamine transferase subunit ALG13